MARLGISWCAAITPSCHPKQIYEKTNSPIPVSLLDLLESNNPINWLFICWKQWNTALFTGCFVDSHVVWGALLHLRHCSDFNTICSDRCTTVLGQLLQTHYNRFRLTDSNDMWLQCIILAYYSVRNTLFTLQEKCRQKLQQSIANWSNLMISRYFSAGYFDRWLYLWVISKNFRLTYRKQN